ncbi:MAG: beta-hydroxyacyl-ACP dehydratase [Candidatus Cryptobacteroides sp.]
MVKDYYKVESHQTREDGDWFTVRLNPDCEVYEGHFPGNPVSPGVCSIQMLKECAEVLLGKRIFIAGMPACRFKVLLNPADYPTLTVHMVVGDGCFKAEVLDGETSCLELKTEFEYEEE